MTLTDNIGRAGFSLGVERVERLVKAFVCRLAGIDGTALLNHSLKNLIPDQWAPVIAEATADKDR